MTLGMGVSGKDTHVTYFDCRVTNEPYHLFRSTQCLDICLIFFLVPLVFLSLLLVASLQGKKKKKRVLAESENGGG